MIQDIEGNFHDAFEESIFGSTSSELSQLYTFSLNNQFYVKLKNNEGEITKSQFLSWNMRASYDVAEDSLRWSPIRSHINTTLPIINLDLGLTAIHNMYKALASGNNLKRINNSDSKDSC